MTTSLSSPNIISATVLPKAMSMPFPSINLASNNLSSPAGTKTVVCVGPSEIGMVSIIGEKLLPVTMSSITAPSKFGCICLVTCSLDNSVVESAKNSSGSSIRRVIEAP
jgi:hypothetical protein